MQEGKEQECPVRLSPAVAIQGLCYWGCIPVFVLVFALKNPETKWDGPIVQSINTEKVDR